MSCTLFSDKPERDWHSSPTYVSLVAKISLLLVHQLSPAIISGEWMGKSISKLETAGVFYGALIGRLD